MSTEERQRLMQSLRDGRPLQETRGQVKPAGAPNEAGGQGVTVKPHTWGCA